MTKSLLLFFVSSTSIVSPTGRLFHQQKVGHGNENKMFSESTENNSFAQTKNIFRFLDPNKKKIFLDSSTQTKKNIFRFLTQTKKIFLNFWDQKKNIFGFLPKTRQLFLSSSEAHKAFSWPNLAVFKIVSAGRLFHFINESRSWKWNKTFRKISRDNFFARTKNIFRFLDPNKKQKKNIFADSSTRNKKK